MSLVNKPRDGNYLARLAAKHGVRVELMARDEVPTDFTGAAVLNLDKADGPGSHWVAFWWDGAMGEYFDSYGFPPTESVEHMSDGGLLSYNARLLQDFDGQSCGYWAVAFLVCASQGVTLAQFIGQFNQSSEVGRAGNNRRLAEILGLRYNP